MSYHPLLQEQVKKFLPKSLSANKELEQFLCAVSDSYHSYEKNNELTEKAFRINEEEYSDITNQLKHETENKQKTKEIVDVAGKETAGSDTDDQLVIPDYPNNKITGRKNAEQTLSLLITNLQSGVLMEDETGCITFVNNMFCKMFDIDAPAEELSGVRYADSAKANSHLFQNPEAYFENSKKIIENKKPVIGDVLQLANGKLIERDFIPVFINEEYKGCLYTYWDITEKKKTQDIIRTALERVGDNVWEHDYTKDQTTFSKTDIEMIDYKAGTDRKLSELWMEHIHPDDRYIVTALDKQYKSGDINDHEEEYRMVNKDGVVYWVLDRGLMLERAADGSPLKTLGTHTDITKIKETELALRESEQSFRSIAETIPGLIYKYHYQNKKGTFIYISPNAESKIGITPEQLENFYSILHPDDYKREKEIRKRTIEKSVPYRFEGRFVVPGKPLIWLSISSSLTRAHKDGTLVYTGIITNITKEKEAALALQIKEEKYRNIIANMNLGLMEVDNNDEIQSVNNSFCQMSGYAAAELVGHKAGSVFLRGDNIRIMDQKNEMRKKGYSDAYEMAVKNKDGEPKWWLISGAPSYNDEGEMVGTIGIHLDITEQKTLQGDLIKAREQAEESARSKQVFLANVSHEIRTPMNAIIGMSKQLTKSPLNQQQRIFTDTIHTAADNLMVVINDVLDLSKMEAGKLNIEKIGFRLKDVLHRAINVMAHKAEEKGLMLNMEPWDISIADTLLGDPYRMNQVLLNLLSNAVKFTEQGSITVSCRVLQNSGQSQVIQISVEDTGIGMDENYINKIFDAFNQESNSNTRKYGGTGLGMHICRQLVEMMGGSIEVKSKKGVGTKIIVVIEYTKGVSEDIDSNEIQPLETDKLNGKKILVADDNDMNRFLLTVIFQNYNCTIIEAGNGKEAIRVLEKEEIDIVLMDVQMPLLDGMQATRHIREKMKNDVPIVALTANVIQGYHERYLQCGMDSYVAKPFKEDELLRTIVRWIDKKRNRQADVVKINPDTGKEKNGQLYNLSQLVAMSRGNCDFVTKMIRLFIEQAQIFITETTAAIEHKDFKKVAAMAHKFKPGISSICQPFLFTDIKNVEQIAIQGESLARLKQASDNFLAQLNEVINQLKEEL